MSIHPPYLKNFREPRLLPTGSDSSREGRITSIFLSILPQTPVLADALLSTIGQKVGQRSKLSSYAEVEFSSKDYDRIRPDGLMELSTSRSSWACLVEVKTGKDQQNPDQITAYAEAARAVGIPAIITISNQFAARPDHPPVQISKTLARKVSVYHWSWAMILMQCKVLLHKELLEDSEQRYLVSEFVVYMEDPKSGVERFYQMNADWQDMVQGLTKDDKLQKTSTAVEEAVGAWFQEERDLSLHLSEAIGEEVTLVLERKFANDPSARFKATCVELAETERLNCKLKVPNAASDIEVTADLRGRATLVSMRLTAPKDKVSTSARVNWLLRMIKEDDERLSVRALWPGKTLPTAKSVAELRSDPTVIQPSTVSSAPHGFEVFMTQANGRRFSGRRTVIEDIETMTKDFYELVGQNLRAWRPAPPKTVKPKVDDEPRDEAEED